MEVRFESTSFLRDLQRSDQTAEEGNPSKIQVPALEKASGVKASGVRL
jgi:hypothetical protein